MRYARLSISHGLPCIAISKLDAGGILMGETLEHLPSVWGGQKTKALGDYQLTGGVVRCCAL
jgi:hypothetical protein